MPAALASGTSANTLLHARLSPVGLRLQLRILDHRQRLPYLHEVADIMVDLRDIAGVLGVKIGDEECLDGRRDDNGRELPALVVTCSLRHWVGRHRSNTWS